MVKDAEVSKTLAEQNNDELKLKVAMIDGHLLIIDRVMELETTVAGHQKVGACRIIAEMGSRSEHAILTALRMVSSFNHFNDLLVIIDKLVETVKIGEYATGKKDKDGVYEGQKLVMEVMRHVNDTMATLTSEPMELMSGTREGTEAEKHFKEAFDKVRETHSTRKH